MGEDALHMKYMFRKLEDEEKNWEFQLKIEKALYIVKRVTEMKLEYERKDFEILRLLRCNVKTEETKII